MDRKRKGNSWGVTVFCNTTKDQQVNQYDTKA